METSQEMNNSKGSKEDQHPLYKTWVLWGHMPHDTDWSLKSYIQICEVDTIEKVTKATGIKAIVKTVSNVVKKDCGCGKRKDTLNKLFPYNK